MTSFLLLTAIVIFACVFLNRVSDKLGIPVLLAFILLGMFFGSDGPINIAFENWSMAKPVAAPAIVLSSAGVVVTALLTGGFIHFILGEPWLLSFLMGSVIASTDAASVFSILRAKRLNLKYHTASLLEVESGST